jgi:hypothetical protein
METMNNKVEKKHIVTEIPTAPDVPTAPDIPTVTEIPKYVAKDKRKNKKYIVASNFKSFCDKCKVSNYTIGMYIRGWHIMTPIYTIILMFYVSKLFYHILIFNLLFVFFAFIYFNGCVLTVLETKLCGDTFTFIDPILEYNNIELNSKNRYNVSFIVANLYLLVTFIIYFYRFKMKA